MPHQSYPKMVYLHPKDKTKVHRTKIVHTEDERRRLAGRVYHTDSQGETTAFNFDPDDPLFKMRKASKPRWTAAERNAAKTAKAEAAATEVKRSKPSRLKQLIGK